MLDLKEFDGTKIFNECLKERIMNTPETDLAYYMNLQDQMEAQDAAHDAIFQEKLEWLLSNGHAFSEINEDPAEEPYWLFDSAMLKVFLACWYKKSEFTDSDRQESLAQFLELVEARLMAKAEELTK